MMGWRRPDPEPDLDELRALGDINGMYDNPYDPDHFLTPLERALVDMFKARPVRMKALQRDLRWLRREVNKRGADF